MVVPKFKHSQPAPYPRRKRGRSKGPTGYDYRVESIKRRCELLLRMHQSLAARKGEPVDCSEVLASVARNLALFPPSAEAEAKFLKGIIDGKISEANWPEEDRKQWADGELKEWARRELKKIPRFSRYKAGRMTKGEARKLVTAVDNTPGGPFIDKAAKRMGMSEDELVNNLKRVSRHGFKVFITMKNGRKYMDWR